MASAPSRPIITCHVLDAAAGKPAANIPVTLTLASPASTTASIAGLTSTAEHVFQGKTNDDGRVTQWQSVKDGAVKDEKATSEVLLNALSLAREGGLDSLVWTLRFDVAAYFAGTPTFWDVIDIRFMTVLQGEDAERGHWHVPLLLSPWSYTTYRGS